MIMTSTNVPAVDVWVLALLLHLSAGLRAMNLWKVLYVTVCNHKQNCEFIEKPFPLS